MVVLAASPVGTPPESWDRAVEFEISKTRSHLARLPEPDFGGGGAGRQGGGGLGVETTGGSAASDCAGEIPLLGGV